MATEHGHTNIDGVCWHDEPVTDGCHPDCGPLYEWECGSCGAIIDPRLVESGELYHAADADCRAIRAVDGAVPAAPGLDVEAVHSDGDSCIGLRCGNPEHGWTE